MIQAPAGAVTTPAPVATTIEPTAVVTQASLEHQFDNLRASIRTEVDQHFRTEVDRLLQAALGRFRTEVTDLVKSQVDQLVTLRQNESDGSILSRVVNLETVLDNRFDVLSSRIEAVKKVTEGIPPDVQMIEQVQTSTAVEQLRAKNEIIHELRTELSALKQGRQQSTRQVVTTDPLGHTEDSGPVTQGASLDRRTSQPRVKLGPRAEGLTEIIPDDPRFIPVLNYRRYRLVNTDPRQDADITAEVGLHVRRLDHSLKTRKFTGLKPVGVISFLDHFKRECDMNRISEGAALLCLPKFLDGDAFISFDANQSIGFEDVGGFSTYPAAVNYLLRTYASDVNIEAAVDAFESIQQDEKESVQDFARRVRKTARECGGVYTERELITRFQRGIRQEIRPLLTREPHEARIASLHEAAALANKVMKSYAQLATTITTAGRKGELPINLKTASTLPASSNSVSLIDNINVVGHVPALGAPSSVGGENSVLLKQDAAQARATSVQPLLAESVKSSQTSVPPVAPKPSADGDIVASLERVHEWQRQQLERNRQRSGGSNGNGNSKPRLQQKSALELYMTLICYLCFGRGHISTNCPFKGATEDPHTKEQYEQFARAQFKALSDKEQESLAKNGHVPAFIVDEPDEVDADPAEPTGDAEK